MPLFVVQELCAGEDNERESSWKSGIRSQSLSEQVKLANAPFGGWLEDGRKG